MTTESGVTELRKTGISVIGEVGWGTHFCYFYETKQDLLDTLALYFKAGLESNEFCLWVISQALSVEEAKHALGQAIPDLERYLSEGALEIHHHAQWYLRNGRWDSQRVLQSWREKLNQTPAQDYAGSRAAGDGGWIQNDDWMGFREYEKQVNAIIADQRSIILCTYPLTTTPGDQVFDVAHIHQVAVARRNGNWEIIETTQLKEAKAEIKRLNEELEQKVEERTRELAATNEALRRQILEREEIEKQSRALINAIPQQIWSGPSDGTLDYCNERWRSYMGIGLEELRGDGWQAMLHPDDRDRVLKAWHEAVLNGASYEQEERHRSADGNYRWFLARGVPMRDTEGRIVRWYGTNTDIEDRKQAEKQLERYTHLLQSFSRRLFQVQEEERRHLARELHDEIGQALTAAKINTVMLRSAIPSDLAPRLNENAAILDRLLQQTRQISLDLRPPLLDDLGLVPALRWYVNQQAERAGLGATFSADPLADDVPPHIQLACFRLAQEAITNVVRHAQAKNLKLELRRSESFLRLLVHDDGKGFDLAAAEARAEQGASLGLLGMKERAALAGGGVRITSSPGEGTTIEVFLPSTPCGECASYGPAL